MDLKLLIRGLWDRIGAWVLIGLGALALLLGWLGVSDTPLPSEQIPYVVSGGLVGISLVGIGATLLITAELRDEWRKLDRIEEALRGERPEVAQEPSMPAEPEDHQAATLGHGTTAAEPAAPTRSRRRPLAVGESR